MLLPPHFRSRTQWFVPLTLSAWSRSRRLLYPLAKNQNWAKGGSSWQPMKQSPGGKTQLDSGKIRRSESSLLREAS